VGVRLFGDSNDLLADNAPCIYDFHLLDLMLPGVDGAELIRILRRRTGAGGDRGLRQRRSGGVRPGHRCRRRHVPGEAGPLRAGRYPRFA